MPLEATPSSVPFWRAVGAQKGDWNVNSIPTVNMGPIKLEQDDSTIAYAHLPV